MSDSWSRVPGGPHRILQRLRGALSGEGTRDMGRVSEEGNTASPPLVEKFLTTPGLDFSQAELLE